MAKDGKNLGGGDFKTQKAPIRNGFSAQKAPQVANLREGFSAQKAPVNKGGSSLIQKVPDNRVTTGDGLPSKETGYAAPKPPLPSTGGGDKK